MRPKKSVWLGQLKRGSNALRKESKGQAQAEKTDATSVAPEAEREKKDGFDKVGKKTHE